MDLIKKISGSARWKDNRAIIWGLTVVLALVWGEVLYQFFRGEIPTNTEENDKVVTISATRNRHKTDYIFDADVRDPFAYRKPEEHHIIPRPVVKPIWIPPPLKLEGMIIKHGRRTAIIESLDGRTFFASVGDTLYGAKILSIDNAKVNYLYQKKDTIWVLGR